MLYPKPMTESQLLALAPTAAFYHFDVVANEIRAYYLTNRDEGRVKSDETTLTLSFVHPEDVDFQSLYFGNGDAFLKDTYLTEQDALLVQAYHERIVSDPELYGIRSLDMFDALSSGNVAANDTGIYVFLLHHRGFSDAVIEKALREGALA